MAGFSRRGLEDTDPGTTISAGGQTSPESEDAEDDDLTEISGIGPAIAARLNESGVTRFSQMAHWTDDDMDRLADYQIRGTKRSDFGEWREQAINLVSLASPPQEGVAFSAHKPEREQVPPTTIVRGGGEIDPENEGDEPSEYRHRRSPKDDPEPVEEYKRGKRVRHRLNRNQKFSEVVGSYHGARFTQDDRYFANDDTEIFIVNDEVVDDPDAKLEGEHAVTSTAVDLKDWMARKTEYPWPLVAKAIRERYNRVVSDEAAAAEFLASQGIRGR